MLNIKGPATLAGIGRTPACVICRCSSNWRRLKPRQHWLRAVRSRLRGSLYNRHNNCGYFEPAEACGKAGMSSDVVINDAPENRVSPRARRPPEGSKTIANRLFQQDSCKIRLSYCIKSGLQTLDFGNDGGCIQHIERKVCRNCIGGPIEFDVELQLGSCSCALDRDVDVDNAHILSCRPCCKCCNGCDPRMPPHVSSRLTPPRAGASPPPTEPAAPGPAAATGTRRNPPGR